MNDIAIKVNQLSKMYKLYEKPMDRLKESLGFSRKKCYTEHYALNNISFEVKKGETIGIIGTNGSGKSTILKIITGVLNATDGSVEVEGRISALLELGAGFNMEYTGIENIYLNGTMMGYSKAEIEKKIPSIIEFADIGNFINQPVKSYSSGMFARLAFAVAINVEPDILIVDEALSVGDVFFQSKCFAKFEKLRKNGTTILFVSHDIGSVRQMCSKVLWLEKGVQKMFGDKEEVCRQYINQQFAKENELNKEIVDNSNLSSFNSKDRNINSLLYPRINIGENSILSDKVEIISCFFMDKEENIVRTLDVSTEYIAYVVGKINIEHLDKLIFGFILENSKGVNLLAFNTFINNYEYVIEGNKDEILEVKFKFTLPKIIKGEYLISPAIARGSQQNNEMLTWLHGALAININNQGYNTSLIQLDAETIIDKYHCDDVKFIAEVNS